MWGRRLPIYQVTEKDTFWHCEKCGNFADKDDVIIRELSKTEIDAMNKKLEDFKKNVVLTGEKMSRRKGVNWFSAHSDFYSIEVLLIHDWTKRCKKSSRSDWK